MLGRCFVKYEVGKAFVMGVFFGFLKCLVWRRGWLLARCVNLFLEWIGVIESFCQQVHRITALLVSVIYTRPYARTLFKKLEFVAPLVIMSKWRKRSGGPKWKDCFIMLNLAVVF